MDFEREIASIKERNERVEADKAWEVSNTRKLLILVITYFVAVVWLYSIGESGYWLKAFVPALGWLLSTMTLPLVKKWWSNRL